MCEWKFNGKPAFSADRAQSEFLLSVYQQPTSIGTVYEPEEDCFEHPGEGYFKLVTAATSNGFWHQVSETHEYKSWGGRGWTPALFLRSEAQILMGRLGLNFLPIRTKVPWDRGYLRHSYRPNMGMVVSVLATHRHLMQNCFSFVPVQLLSPAESVRPRSAG